jgi:hypothetical protein
VEAAVYLLASTDMATTRDLTPSGTLHAYTDGIGTTVCGLVLGRQVRLFPDSTWEQRPSGSDCSVCADGVRRSG